jgi:hypothetical protein
VVAELAGGFELEAHQPLRHRSRLDVEALRDLLASTYRGARNSERQRVEGVGAMGAMDVTSNFDLLIFRPAMINQK